MGVGEFVILGGYLADKLMACANGVKKSMGIEIKYSVEKKPLELLARSSRRRGCWTVRTSSIISTETT